jgi:hypothetical protein
MPWKAFEIHATEHKLILIVDEGKLMTAPGFEKHDKWPDFPDGFVKVPGTLSAVPEP